MAMTQLGRSDEVCFYQSSQGDATCSGGLYPGKPVPPLEFFVNKLAVVPGGAPLGHYINAIMRITGIHLFDSSQVWLVHCEVVHTQGLLPALNTGAPTAGASY